MVACIYGRHASMHASMLASSLVTCVCIPAPQLCRLRTKGRPTAAVSILGVAQPQPTRASIFHLACYAPLTPRLLLRGADAPWSKRPLAPVAVTLRHASRSRSFCYRREGRRAVCTSVLAGTEEVFAGTTGGVELLNVYFESQR